MARDTTAWEARLDGLDPSVLAALATLVRYGDTEGGLPLADLIRGYHRILVASRHDGDAGWHEAAGFRDSMLEQVQGFVLPRLVEGGWIRGPGDRGWDRIIPEGQWFAEAVRDREGSAARILERAFPRAPTVRPVPQVEVVVGGSVLSCDGLDKAFRRRRVVRDVSLRLEQGEVVGLLGPNGAGKTTTFYLITGLIAPDRGTIHLDDQDITDAPMYRRARMGIGYLAQEPSVFRKLTVEQNIMAILETQPLSRQERRARLEELLAELGLAHLRRNKAYSLSGGERRRLEITRALVTRPKFMLLDEPFAGVDPIAVHDIQTIVSSLRHRGIGVLITDHNVEQTLEIVDRAYIMFEGSVQASGTVRELVYNDSVADLYLGPTLTARLRARLERVR
jgi:lipopolysaccharide export system ATP-binding protein